MNNEIILNTDNMNNVRFRKVTYPGVTSNKYFVSEYGDIYNTATEKFLLGTLTKRGYRQHGLDGLNIKTHRLVAYEFVHKNRDLSLTIDHIDGNKLNNHYTNLEWVSLEENLKRAFNNGLLKTSSLNQYPDELIHRICEMYEQYNYSPIEVYQILRNIDKTPRGNKESEAFYRMLVSLRRKEYHKDITSQYNYDATEKIESIRSIYSNSIFTTHQIQIIAKMYTEGASIADITKIFVKDSNDPMFSKYYSNIHRIVHRVSWTNITDEIFEAAGDFKAKKSTNGKFNETQVHMICKYIAEGDNPHMVLSKLGYFKSHPDYKKLYETVGRITNGKYWRHISKDYFEPRKLKEKAEYHLDDDLIREMVAHGYGMKDICTVYGMGTKIENPNYYRAILAKVSKFRKLQSESELTLEELNELIINAWAAEW